MKRYAIRFRDLATHTWRTIVVRVDDHETEDHAKNVARVALGLDVKLGELHAIVLEGEDLRAVGPIVTVGLDEHLREPEPVGPVNLLGLSQATLGAWEDFKRLFRADQGRLLNVPDPDPSRYAMVQEGFYPGDFVRPRGQDVRWQVASGPVTEHDDAYGRTLLVLTPTPDGMITQAYDPAGFVLVERAHP